MPKRGLGSNADGWLIGETSADPVGFFGATPVAQPAATVDLLTALQTLGFVASGGSYLASSPLTIGTSAAPVTYAGTGTENVLEVDGKMTSVSGTLRGILSSVEYSGTNVGATTNVHGVRGYVKVSGTFAAGDQCFAAGVQGKCEVSGTLTDGNVMALFGQINSSAGTLTSGTISALWCDNQISSKALGRISGGSTSTLYMQRITNSNNSALIDAFQYFGVTANYWAVLDFQNGNGSYPWLTVSTGKTPTNPYAVLKVKYISNAGVAADGYIPIYGTWS